MAPPPHIQAICCAAGQIEAPTLYPSSGTATLQGDEAPPPAAQTGEAEIEKSASRQDGHGAQRRQKVHQDAATALHDILPSIQALIEGEGEKALLRELLSRTRAGVPEDAPETSPALQVLLTVYQAGVQNQARLNRYRPVLQQVLDALRVGLLVLDRFGRVLHANPTTEEMLAADPDRERIREEIEVLTRSCCLLAESRRKFENCDGSVTLTREVRTRNRRYTLRGILLEQETPAAEAAVLAILEPHTPAAPSDEELKKRFGLTGQEIRIARAISMGQTNNTVAKALSLSVHTVRHHVERILSKLEVRSRTEVAPILLTGAQPGEG